ncbi:MAG: lysylphosphatidylglycerol synthase domain-containing protein [Solirubrobacteraceae bacterium]
MSAEMTEGVRAPEHRARLARFARIGAWLAAIALVLFVLDKLGVPVTDWIRELFKNVRSVPAGAIVAGCMLDTFQTVFAALSWLTILRAAFPDAALPFRPVLASYAVAVALNGFLPANLGTLVMMVMFLSLIAGATFAAILSGFFVQKIPFSVYNIAAYIYLFATVTGSLSFELGFLSKHPGLSVLIAIGGVVLLVIVARVLWHRATKLREQIKSGGAILGQPRRFMIGVALPQLASYAARLGIVAVFLAAYSIPVTFHSVVAVSASNSVSNSVSVTPGSAGVTQALNVVVLDSITTKSQATAYSVAQQLIITAWDILFGIAMVAWVFGWSGGKQLVRQSYEAAEVKRDELKEQHAARRAERPHRFRLHR